MKLEKIHSLKIKEKKHQYSKLSCSLARVDANFIFTHRIGNRRKKTIGKKCVYELATSVFLKVFLFKVQILSNVYLMMTLVFLGEKQAATHVSLDQEYDSESSQQWQELEEQVVAVVNKGVIPSNFHPTQYCLNSFSDNSRFPLAVVEGDIIEFLIF